MDGGGYGSAAHLSSPALVVFSQAANGLSDAFRLQRPFHASQVSSSSFAAAAIPGMRPSGLNRLSSLKMPDPKDLHHLSLVGSYGAHLLHGFPPHFLHSSLTGGGSQPTFGSNGGGAFVKPFPSAFAPPPKCIGGGTASESFRTSESSSPACNSMSPPVKEESMEGHTSEDGDHRDRICTPERSPDTPGFRREFHLVY